MDGPVPGNGAPGSEGAPPAASSPVTPAGDDGGRRTLPAGRAATTLLVVNVLVYGGLWALHALGPGFPASGLGPDEHWGILLSAFGAKVNDLIDRGEVWRYVSPVFLHANLLHLLFNGFALFEIGGLLELLVGPGFLLWVYVVAGAGGSLASYAFSSSPSVGASGAIFGLGGGLLALGLWMRRGPTRDRSRAILSAAVPFCFYNIVIGAVIPNVDNFAHLGGLVSGFLAMSLAFLLIRCRVPVRAVSVLGGLAGTGGLLLGFAWAAWTGPAHLDTYRGTFEAVKLQNSVFNRHLTAWNEAYNQVVTGLHMARVAGTTGRAAVATASLLPVRAARQSLLEALEEARPVIHDELNRRILDDLVAIVRPGPVAGPAGAPGPRPAGASPPASTDRTDPIEQVARERQALEAAATSLIAWRKEAGQRFQLTFGETPGSEPE